MVRHVLLLLALVACKNTDVPPPPPATPATRLPGLPVISDELASQIGNFGFGAALDLTKLDREMIAGLLPASPTCMGSAIRSAKTVVLTQTGDSWHAYVTGVAKADLDACVGMFGPDLAVTAKGDLSVISSGSDAQLGGMSATIVELLHEVPKTAIGWVVSSGLPKAEITALVGWLKTAKTTWAFTVRVEAKDQATALKFVDGVKTGALESFKEKGATADPGWFVISTTQTSATLVATVPLSALALH